MFQGKVIQVWMSGSRHRDKIRLEEVRDGQIIKGLIGQGKL